MKITFTLVSFIFFHIFSIAQPGALDATFGSGGKVIHAIGNSLDEALAMAIQSDGKIVLAGQSFDNVTTQMAVSRYLVNGTPDPTFDGDGKVIITFPTFSQPSCLAIQSDGKIVLGGRTQNGTPDFFAIARLNTNGSLDLSFDADGKVTTAIQLSDRINGIIIQPDGKIVAAGQSSSFTSSDIVIARYNTNGSLDLTFDGDGVVITPSGSQSTYIKAIALQADSKIVVAGYYAAGGNNTNFDFLAARYNADGSRDLTFDSDGKATTPIGTAADMCNAVAVQSDGKIVLAGYSFNGNNKDFAVVRFNSNGMLDANFDSDGKVTTQVDISDDEAHSIAVQSDGKILAAGYSNNYDRQAGIITRQNFTLLRYQPNGGLDTGFADGGRAITQVGFLISSGYGMALNQNRIYICGEAFNLSSRQDFAIVAYLMNDVALPLTLAGFATVRKDETIICTWQTLNEENTAYFVIERSADGRMFQPVGMLQSAGFAQNASYTFSDLLSAADRTQPVLYYRLKMADKSGQFAYSAVRSIVLQGKPTVRLFPNPANKFITVSGGNIHQVQLFDQAGRKVRTQIMAGGNIIDVSALARGWYLLQLTDKSGHITSEKVLVQH